MEIKGAERGLLLDRALERAQKNEKNECVEVSDSPEGPVFWVFAKRKSTEATRAPKAKKKSERGVVVVGENVRGESGQMQVTVTGGRLQSISVSSVHVGSTYQCTVSDIASGSGRSGRRTVSARRCAGPKIGTMRASARRLNGSDARTGYLGETLKRWARGGWISAAEGDVKCQQTKGCDGVVFILFDFYFGLGGCSPSSRTLLR